MSDAENHVWTDHEQKCWHCGEPTKWLELSFEAPLHPGECTDTKYAELAEADRQAAEAVDREWEKSGEPRPGDRKVENGQTFQWTGAAWRLVPRSELDAEAWRKR